MKRFLKVKVMGVFALAAGMVASIATLPVNAAAYTPQGVCGSGYYVQRSHKLKGAKVYQLYNGSTNCVVTMKTSSVGKPTRVTAGLKVKGKSWSYDTGDYKYYAGPVKMYAKGKCVKFFGYHKGTNYTSPWGNCG